MEDQMRCYVCGNINFDCDNGFYYCTMCNSQVDDIAEMGNDDEFMDPNARGPLYTQSKVRPTVKIEPETLLSQPQFEESQFMRSFTCKHEQIDDREPSGPSDFGGAVDYIDPEMYSSEIRMRYVQGIQVMIQSQCEALVEKFGVSPLISGLVGGIWLRYVAVSRVFDEKWSDDVMQDSENLEGLSLKKKIQIKDDLKKWKPRYKHHYEPFNINHQRLVLIWFRSLRKRIPVSTSLAVSFLACHVAREVILPTEILNWALEGKLPYLTAFIDIGKRFKFRAKPSPTSLCPLTASFMFKPSQVLGSKELESQAGSIAQKIGLELPPVNFHAIACRYLKQLSLPVDKILPHASRIREWSMPSDLWLSANRHRLPTRVCVMSLLMIAIRILYNINGFGKWEESLSSSQSSTLCRKVEKSSSPCKSKKSAGNTRKCSQPSGLTSKYDSTYNFRKRKRSAINPLDKHKKKNGITKTCPSSTLHEFPILRGLTSIEQSDFDAAQLLLELETLHERISHVHDYSKDMKTYLNFCKDVVCTRLTPMVEDDDEENTIQEMWKLYENQEGTGDEGCARDRSMNGDTRPGDNGCTNSGSLDNDGTKRVSDKDGCSASHEKDPFLKPPTYASVFSLKEKKLRKMKLNMAENGFIYIPPREKLKRFDYLHYIRKNDEGCRSYVAHADYYILLRACARVAQVDIQYMHAAVLRMEKRLAWIQNRIDHGLWSVQNLSTKSNNVDKGSQQDISDTLDFFGFNLVL